MAVHYKDFGPIAHVAAAGAIVPRPQDVVWTGAITAQKDRAFTKRMKAVIGEDNIKDYFVHSDLSARMRCIDGRVLEHYQDDLALQHRPLGPQVPGGTAMAALTFRILQADSLSSDVSFTQDIDDIVSQFAQKGLGFGGHVDDIDHPHGDTGCGAIDNIPTILERIASPSAQQELRGLTALLLGNRYDDITIDTILGRIINLQSVADHYFMRNKKTGRYGYRQKVVEDLRKNGKGADPIARLVGPHSEVALVVNTVRGTTFDPDRFSIDNGNDIQMFNYDFWSTQHGATILYPVNNDITYNQAKRNLRTQHEYLTCRVLLAVATTMVLTDGTVHLVVRTGKQ